jgi:serine/threonine protein kinase
MPASPTPVDRPVLPSRLPEGTRTGRYAIDGWVRDGGMSVVYRGHHVETRTKVAIKVIAERYATEAELVARFEREGQVMGRLAGQFGVVSVHDVGTLLDGRRYLVMEWIDGEDLEDLLDHVRNRDTRIEVPRACRITRDVARGIAAAHARQVVHRDLKPSNVMLDRRDGVERAKIVDFGVSADLGARERGEDLTRTGASLGTSGYMSPEQALGMPADPAFDVWALGVLLYELLTSARLPPALDPQRLPDVRERRPDVPDGIAQLIRACLAVDMRMRPTAAEVASRLDGVLGRLAVKGLRELPTDDRPGDVVGAIERSDSISAIMNRADGLQAPPRITPVRVAVVKATPEQVAAVVKSSAPVEEPSSRMAILVGVAALAVVFAIWATRGMWMATEAVDDSEPATKQEPAVVARADAGGTKRADEGEPSAPRVQPAEPSRVEPSEPPPVEPSQSPRVEPSEPPAEPDVDHSKRPDDGGSSKSTRPTPPEPSGPAHETARCEAQRSKAESAKASRDWDTLLARTRDASCWASSAERVLLRVTALAELGRWDECVRVGSGSSDPDVAKRTKFCRKQQEAG